jgi:hypothetical protein
MACAGCESDELAIICSEARRQSAERRTSAQLPVALQYNVGSLTGCPSFVPIVLLTFDHFYSNL